MVGLVYPGVDPSDVVRDAGVRGGEAQAAPGVRAERDYADLWNNNSDVSILVIKQTQCNESLIDM